MKILCRYILAWAGFFGIMNVYFCRINLSMAVVEMLGSKPSSSNITSECQEFGGNGSMEVEEKEGEFDWDQNERALILGSYYYGYTFMQIPAAWISSKYGFRRSFGYSMLLASILTFLFPTLTRVNLYLGVVARVILGVFHAVSFPCLTGAWGSWAPPLEVTKLNGIAVSGASAGTCIIFYLAGIVIDQWGWPSIFYLTGALSLAWVAGWFYLIYDTPDKHPRIDAEERDHIIKHIGDTGHRADSITPWRAIFFSAPVWGLVLGHTASNWGNYTLNQQLPTYLKTVLRFDLQLSGLLSSICYILQWIVCVLASWFTDWIRQKQFISTIRIRKLNTIIGLWVTALCIVLAGYARCEVYVSVALFLLSAGLNTFTVPGCKSTMLDIAPAYSGIVFGFSNTVANIPGFVAPQLVGLILNENTLAEWQTVFWVSAAVHVAGSILFLVKGSDQLQKWAIHQTTDELTVNNQLDKAVTDELTDKDKSKDFKSQE